MPLTVEWDAGVCVRRGETRLVLDPQARPQRGRCAFVTHAHYDHSQVFDFPDTAKHSTRGTRDLVGVYGKGGGSWEQISNGQAVGIGGLDVIAHNAGHVLGSVMFEVSAPEGRVLYTGDLNPVDTHTMRGAEAVECDILVVEATFGLPCFEFPTPQRLATDMVQWALDEVKGGRVPVIKADSLGNAQEITSIFNRLTNIPVAAHRKVARISRVYEEHGHNLDYVNYDSLKEIEGHLLIAPKRSTFSGHARFTPALASGWALWSKDGEVAFPLSDHADYPHLMQFVEACSPKTVLTCMGGRFDKTFANQVAKRLKIDARPLSHAPTTLP